MKLLSPLFLSLLSAAALAAGGKEITIEGTAACPKCCLKTATECGTHVTVEKNGKKTVYELADNDTAKSLHDTICKKPTTVKVTGVCQKVGDKLQVTASKIEEAK